MIIYCSISRAGPLNAWQCPCRTSSFITSLISCYSVEGIPQLRYGIHWYVSSTRSSRLSTYLLVAQVLSIQVSLNIGLLFLPETLTPKIRAYPWEQQNLFLWQTDRRAVNWKTPSMHIAWAPIVNPLQLKKGTVSVLTGLRSQRLQESEKWQLQLQQQQLGH
jgi:hypothetical protein